MHVLMLGGTGYISGAVLNRLLEAGIELTVFHRGRKRQELPAGVRQVIGNRRQLPEYAPVLRQLQADVVVDTIPLWEEDARHVVDVLTGYAGRMVALSSQDVYRAYALMAELETGELEPLPVTEASALRSKLYPYRGDVSSDPENPDLYYYYDKVLCERVYMSEPQLPGTMLRLPMVYGPHDRQRRLHHYLRRMDDQRRYIILEEGFAAWRWTKGFVEDIAHGVYLAVVNPEAANKVYNLGEERTPSFADWVRIIGSLAGWDGEILTVPKDRLPETLQSGINATQDLLVDTALARKELGYQERVPLELGLERTIAWERAYPVAGEQVDYAEEDAVLQLLGRKPV